MIAVVKKHYSAILRSFPEDFSATREKLLSHGQQQSIPSLRHRYRALNSQIANELIFNDLINGLLSPNNKITPVTFCSMLLVLLGDTPAVRNLIKGENIYLTFYVHV